MRLLAISDVQRFGSLALVLSAVVVVGLSLVSPALAAQGHASGLTGSAVAQPAAVSGTASVVENNTDPTAEFDFGPAEPRAGQEVMFFAEASDPDGDIVDYDWRVNGEKVSVYPRFEYTFDGAGTYEVELTVTDDDGATDTVRKTVTVSSTDGNQLPSATFSATPQQPAPGEKVTFVADATDPDGEVVSYSWQINGQRITGGSEFTVTLSEVREYDVRLTVTDDDGAIGTARKTVSVTESSTDENQPPTAAISPDTTAVDIGQEITLTASASDPDGRITGYTWLVDGTEVGEGPSLTYTFDESGEYVIEVRAVDDGGKSATASRTVTVERTEPANTTEDVRLTAEWWQTPLSPRAGETVTLTAAGEAGDVSYQWDLDGDGEAEKRGPMVSHAFLEPGSRTVTLRVVGPDGEIKTQSATVQVTAATAGGAGSSDAPSFWMSPREPLQGETVTLVASGDGDPETAYRWEIGATEKRGRVVSHRFVADVTTVTLSRVNAEGEVTTRSRTVTTRDGSKVTQRRDGSPSLWTTPLSPQPGEAVTLVADPGATPDSEVAEYRWDLDGDGEPDASGRSVSQTFSAAKQASVTLIVERTNGTTATVEETIVVKNATAALNNTTPDPGEDDPTATATPDSDSQTATASQQSDDTPTAEGTDGAGPGFGFVVTVVALVLAVLVRWRT